MPDPTTDKESRPRARLVIAEQNPARANAAERFFAITKLLAERGERPASVLVEAGLAQEMPFDEAQVTTHVLGFGCPCCIGSLPLQVTLTRVLRHERPKLIILAPLPGAHIGALATFLTEKFCAFLDVEIFHA